MANTELQIVLTAKDEASKTMSGFSKTLKNLQPTFKKMAIGGTAAFAAISGVAIASIKAFNEAKVEMAIATKSIENSIDGLSKGALLNLEKQAGAGKTALSFVTEEMNKAGKAAIKLGFDDEEASKSFSRLFSVTNDTAKAQKDLQLAMDLAAYSGQGLEESAMAIARVYAGSTKELKGFGIEVKDGITPLETLAMLNSKVAGTADASKDSFKVLALQVQNVKESIGAALMPILQDLINKLMPVIENVIKWIEANPTLTKWIIIVGAAVAGLTATLGILGMALPGLITGFTLLWTAIGGPIGLLVIAIGALVVYWIKNWTMLKDNILYIWNVIKDTAMSIWESIKNTVMGALDPIINAIQNFLSYAEKAIAIAKTVGEAVGKAVKVAGNVVSGAGKALGFAEGGIVPGPIGKPVPAIVHGGEMIIPPNVITPLSGQRYAPSSTNNVYITGGYYLSETVAEQIGDLIIKRLKENIKI